MCVLSIVEYGICKYQLWLGLKLQKTGSVRFEGVRFLHFLFELAIKSLLTSPGPFE